MKKIKKNNEKEQPQNTKVASTTDDSVATAAVRNIGKSSRNPKTASDCAPEFCG